MQTNDEFARIKKEPNKTPPVIAHETKPVHGLERLKVKTLRDTKVQLTNERAFAYLELAEFKGERDVSETHVQLLTDEMRRGRFLDDQVIISTCKLGNTVFKINGQHTCWARTNLPSTYQCAVRWIDYEASSEDQLRALYGVIDRGKARSAGHVVKSQLAGTEQFSDLWVSILPKMAAGLKFWLNPANDHSSRLTASAVASLMQSEHAQLVNQVGRFCQDNYTHTHLKRASVWAALMATYNKVPTKAIDFWQPVADGLGLTDKDDPRYRLRELLKSSSLNIGQSDKKAIGPEDMYKVCLLAWNKWRDGEKVRMTLRPTEKRPTVV